jgi:hypothetical protein
VRAELARHFDVVVVIWALTLMVGFTLASLSRAELSNDQWSYPQDGPVWVVPAAQ